MESVKIIQNGYKILIFPSNYFLKISIKSENEKGKNRIKFISSKISFQDSFNKYTSNFEELIKQLKDKTIIVTLEEIFDAGKTYIKYLNIKLLKNDSNKKKEIISKKIYALNIEYYLTKGPNHKRINSFPFFTYIKKDYFNLEDIINIMSEEDLLQIYDFDEYKYFNYKFGCFVDIKNENIKMEEKLIIELHISERKNIIRYYLNQNRKYFNEEIIRVKDKIYIYLDLVTKYDIIFLYASPIIKNESFKEFNAQISYISEIRNIIRLMENYGKKLNLKFECADDKILEDILKKNKTKILHISAHGLYNGEYSLILENLEKNGQILELNMDKLKYILNRYKNNINQMDLVIASTCFSEDLGLLFKEYGAKNVIYIAEKTEILDEISVLFTKYFYQNLFSGKTIKYSFDYALKEIKESDIIDKSNIKCYCCNHYHIPKCLSHKYFHDFIQKIKNEKIECQCKDTPKPNFHKKDCIYYNEFIKYLNDISINKNNFDLIEEENLNKICCCDLKIEHNEIEKIKFESNKEEFGNIKTFLKNNKRKSINSTISFYYDYKKYSSIKGRRGLMGRIFENLTNKGKYVILFGEKNLGKINFTESLCVFLYERKKIKSYEIFRIYSESDHEYMNKKLIQKYKFYYNYSKKNVIVIKFDNENDIINYEYFNKIYERYLLNNNTNNFYFIFIFETKEEKDEKKIFDKYINNFQDIIKKLEEKFNKKILFKLNDEKNNIFYAGFNTLENKLLYQENNFERNENKLENKNGKLTKNDSSYFLCFLIYNMPDGLPDCFLELIFDDYYNIKYDYNLIVKSRINKWNVINNKKQFDENFKETKNIEICCEYIFKTLKLYTNILNYYIKKNRKRMNRKGGIIHYIYNSYSYKNIWNCEIDDSYGKSFEKNINNEDFNIYKHKQNILSLISLIVNKINFFREVKEKGIAEQIDKYIENILLLFPSYFFLEKDNNQILRICIDFCKRLNNNLNEKQKDLLHKLLLFLYSIEESQDEILYVLKNNESSIKQRLKEEINFLKVIRNNDSNPNNLIKLINKDTSEDMKINIYYEISSIYFKNKDYINSIKYLNNILNSKIITNFITYRAILDYCHAFIKKSIENPNDNNYFEIIDKIKILNKIIKNSTQKDMYYESQKLQTQLYNLIEPDIIMLNSNPLQKYSKYIFPLNNQYHILSELKKSVNTHIRIKSLILNEENLEEALNGKGEILIIQSDDFIENDSIVCESENGHSYLLSFEKIANMIKEKILKYKAIILCFPNSSFFKPYLDSKSILYNYIISFNYLEFSSIDKMKKYCKEYVQIVIEFIKNSTNEYDIKKIYENAKKRFIDNIKDIKVKSYFISNLILSIKLTNDINIEYNKEINDNKIFSYSPIPQFDIFDNDNLDSNYSQIIYDLIEEINLVNRKIFYCNGANKNITLKICIEVMKYYHRHKTYYELYCIDIKKRDKRYLKSIMRRLYKTFIEDEEENNNKDDIDEYEEYSNHPKNCFFLIYNCNTYDLFDIDIYSILKCNSSFIIIFDNEKLNFDRKILTQKRNRKTKELNVNYFFNKYGNNDIKNIDDEFLNNNIIREENEEIFDLENLKSYLINNKIDIFKNGNLYQYIKNKNKYNKKEYSPIFEEEEIKIIFYKILKIVENLHNNKYYNLNLKLSNIMLDENYNPIFINFGSTKKCGEKLNNSDIIINEYSPPEFYNENLKYSEFKVDIFNLGIILFILYFGNAPFKIPIYQNNLYKLSQKKNKSNFWEKIYKKYNTENVKIDNDFKNLFLNLISSNPNDRYYIKDILNSKWMKEIAKAFNEKSKKLHELET